MATNSQNNRDDFEIDFEHADPLTTQTEVVFFNAAQKNFLVKRSGKPIQKLTRQ